jgi:transcription elongation factor Elf1
VENVIDNTRVVNDRAKVLAPYGERAIPLLLTSVTGFRYRTLNCMECGAEFLERNNDAMYRLNDASAPAEIMLDGAVVIAHCGNCLQKYHVQVSLNVALDEGGIPLYLQPQSIYIAVDNMKKLRYIYCLECGHAFQTISDRINQVVDNRVPFEQLDQTKIGPLETMCHFSNCQQVWALML